MKNPIAANMFAMHKIRNGMLRNREKSNISFKMFETEAGKHVHLSQKVFCSEYDAITEKFERIMFGCD
jgi:hypothetical protein